MEPNEKISGVNDYFISKNISIRMKKVKDINSSNYKYNTTNAVVFVIGKVQNRSQMDDITSTISTTKGVKKVISYIQF